MVPSFQLRGGVSRRLAAILAVGLLAIGGALAAYPSLRVRQLVQQLRGDEEEGALARQQLIARLGGGAAPLFTRLLRAPEPGVRLQATEALLELQGEASLNPLAPLLGDSHARVRERIVEEASRWNTPRARQVVLTAAADADLWVRQSAVTALAARAVLRGDRDPQTEAALARAVDDHDPAVVAAAMAGMRAIAGKDFGFRARGSPSERHAAVARWRNWWAANAPRATPALPPAAVLAADAYPAPDFALIDVGGNAWSLRKLRGRPVLLHFFGTWCGTCQPEMAELEALHRQRPELPILALGIAEEGPAAMRRYAGQRGFTLSLAPAPEAVAQAYGDIHEVPVTILIDPQGRIRRRFDGARDPETLRSALREIGVSG